MCIKGQSLSIVSCHSGQVQKAIAPLLSLLISAKTIWLLKIRRSARIYITNINQTLYMYLYHKYRLNRWSSSLHNPHHMSPYDSHHRKSSHHRKNHQLHPNKKNDQRCSYRTHYCKRHNFPGYSNPYTYKLLWEVLTTTSEFCLIPWWISL